MPYYRSVATLFLFLSGLSILFLSSLTLHGQTAPSPPVPVEILVGHDRLFFQSLVSKPFVPGSRFGLFTIATYHAGYDNDPDKNELAIPFQVSYTFWKGIGAYAGVAINSNSGMHPVIGPQYVKASKQLLIVVNGRYFLTEDYNLEAFGLVEYKPELNATWSLYSRVQGLYSYNTVGEFHDRSFYHMRLGLMRKNLSFGPGINFDLYGPDKTLKENYGVFVRWEFW